MFKTYMFVFKTFKGLFLLNKQSELTFHKGEIVD
jgi:hypothetical protein